MEHPSPDGFLSFLDVLIHPGPDKSTSVYRKPTHTNLYTKYSSSTTNSAKNEVIRSLTRRVNNICSPQHLDAKLQTSRLTLYVSRPYPSSFPKTLKKILGQHDIKVKHSSSTTLRDLLTKTKSTPLHLTPNTIYKISCLDCRLPFYLRRPDLSTPHRPDERTRTMLQTKQRLRRYSVTLDRNKSAPAHHSLTTGHRITRNNINLLKSLPQHSHLNLTEHAAIHVRNPAMNRTDSAPKSLSAVHSGTPS